MDPSVPRLPTDRGPEDLAARIEENHDVLASARRGFYKENIEIGGNARRIRERFGFSLRSMANAMGVSASFLSDLEAGHRVWTVSNHMKWHDALEELLPPDDDE